MYLPITDLLLYTPCARRPSHSIFHISMLIYCVPHPVIRLIGTFSVLWNPSHRSFQPFLRRNVFPSRRSAAPSPLPPMHPVYSYTPLDVPVTYESPRVSLPPPPVLIHLSQSQSWSLVHLFHFSSCASCSFL